MKWQTSIGLPLDRTVRLARLSAGRSYERVGGLAGSVHGGPPELGARYRKYLREGFGRA